jgi:chromosome segregation ATPase
MSDAEKACQATPFAELERQMMDANVPKNEREWWSWREINNLRDTITRLQAEVQRLNSEQTDAYTDLNSARQDNGSFTTEFKRLTAEVERLTSENQRLRAALTILSDHWKHGYGGPTRADVIRAVEEISRAALAQEKPHER